MTQIVIMPGGFHPFHAGHYALYQSARKAFPKADVYVAATDDTSTRPFPFPVKEKLAQLAGVEPGRFIQVKSPFRAEEITTSYNPEKDVLIFVRSEKDANKPPQAGGVKRDGTPSYLQPLQGQTRYEPFAKHAYMAYLPTVEFGPGMTSATEIRNAWPTLNEKRKTALVMSLYPKTQTNSRLAANVVKMLDTALGVVDENVLDNLPRPNKRNQFKSLHKQRKQRGLDEQGVAEGQENFNGIDISMEIQKDDEYVDDEDYDNQVIYVTASSNGKELGHVLFAFDGEYLMPQDLEVEERYRGQGIAQTMYDYVKSKGYKIRRSGQQTDAGTGFWDKHKPGKNVWEQGVAEASLGNVLSWPEVVNKVSSAMKATGWKVQRQGENAFMFTTKGQETDDQWYIAMISNVGEGFFAYALGTVEDGDPHIDDAYRGQLPTTEASVSELMNEIRDGFGLNESVAEAAKKCPPATQDITLNLENRQKAIDEYGYGPLNPDLPNTKFWMLKVDEWNLDSMEEAQQSLCGNCAAFDIRQDTLDCIAQGIDSDSPEDAEGVIDAGDLGYCKFLKFKCASRRTCDAWVTGGPLQDKPVDENQGWAATYETNAQNFVGGMKASYQDRENQPVAEQDLDYIEEKWSQKYKSSINCANPKGFSQKAHCAGRKK